jgi:hypothetical protein
MFSGQPNCPGLRRLYSAKGATLYQPGATAPGIKTKSRKRAESPRHVGAVVRSKPLRFDEPRRWRSGKVFLFPLPGALPQSGMKRACGPKTLPPPRTRYLHTSAAPPNVLPASPVRRPVHRSLGKGGCRQRPPPKGVSWLEETSVGVNGRPILVREFPRRSNSCSLISR